MLGEEGVHWGICPHLMRHWLPTVCLSRTGCSLIQLLCLLKSFLDDIVMCAIEYHFGQSGMGNIVGWHYESLAQQHCDRALKFIIQFGPFLFQLSVLWPPHGWWRASVSGTQGSFSWTLEGTSWPPLPWLHPTLETGEGVGGTMCYSL